MAGDSSARTSKNGLRQFAYLTIPATVEAISQATDRLHAILAQLEIAEDKRQEIGLALQEALANAVVHGCQKDPSKTVSCRLCCDPQGRVLITVADPGAGFDPDAVPDPLNGNNRLATHGRGIYLIRQLMDEVRFENGGSEIHMWKY